MQQSTSKADRRLLALVGKLSVVAVLLAGLFLLWPAAAAMAQGCSSTVVVTSTLDSGAGTLRQSLLDACAGGTISFAPALTTGGPATITLASTLEISQNLIIDGPGADLLNVSGNNAVGVVQINPGATVQLAGMSIIDGLSWNGGGGIQNAGNLAVVNSRLFHNATGGGTVGGGIFNTGILTITGSTIHGNHATNGGAVYNSAGSVLLSNSTIADNVALLAGGGICNLATLVGVNTTVANNSAAGNSLLHYGGGVYSPLGSVSLTNTIVANSGAAGDIVATPGVVTLANTLSGTVALEPLADNGGPTWTMALAYNSPAIDSGNNAACAAPPVAGVDQRGVPRPQGASCDIGAFEAPPQVYVQNLNDSGPGSLRQAMADAPIDTTIYFSPALTAGGPATLTLASTLPVTQSVNIIGPGSDLLTVSGNNAVGVFQINTGATAVLNGLTIAEGSAPQGGGIQNDGRLTLLNSTVAANTANAGGYGGGVYNAGECIVSGSTFTGNLGAAGGGVYNGAGSLWIGNSTFFGNAATAGSGGAIANAGVLAVVNATLAGNSATQDGGGLSSPTMSASLTNTIVANNTVGGQSNDIGAGPVTRAYVLTGALALGPLADNGGPTWTMALPDASPAMDAGDNAACAAFPVDSQDQRGLLRPQGPRCDIGAYETVHLVVQTLVDGQPGSLRNVLSFAQPEAVVTFSPTLTADGPATMSLLHSLAIQKNVVIVGPGAGKLTINVQNGGSIFTINSGLVVYLEGLTIANGSATTGGGIYVDGSQLTLANMVFTGNTASTGGAIYGANSQLLLANTNLLTNSASSMGGAIYATGGQVTVLTGTLSANTAGSDGGAIYQDGGQETVLTSTLSSNTASNAGGAIYQNGGQATVANSTLNANSNPSEGGAVYVNSGGSLAVQNATLNGNNAANNGGAIFVAAGGAATVLSSTVENNEVGYNETVDGSVDGGGIMNLGSLQVMSSTFNGNRASSCPGTNCKNGYVGGGAIANGSGAFMTVSYSTIENNVSVPGFRSFGGGISNMGGATGAVSNSTFNGNAATKNSYDSGDGSGGDIFNQGTITLTNNTFVGSVSSANGGNVANSGTCTGSGCQLQASSRTAAATPAVLVMVHNTIVGSDTSGTSSVIVHNMGGAILHMVNTIIAHGACLNEGGTLATNISNLIEDGSCAENAVNLRTGDARLAPIADNGGPTRTAALQPSSPAIDGADPRYCTSTDQRGVLRPHGAACDIGAYEGAYQYLPAIAR